MTPTKDLVGMKMILTLLGFAPRRPRSLGAYNADIGESSISGVSSGAFMAVQFATAWSGTIRGVDVIASGPLLLRARYPDWRARRQYRSDPDRYRPPPVGPPPALEPLIKQTDQCPRHGDIDATEHIAGQKIYLFDGYNDAVVSRTVTDATHRFYFHYLSDRNRATFSIKPR